MKKVQRLVIPSIIFVICRTRQHRSNTRYSLYRTASVRLHIPRPLSQRDSHRLHCLCTRLSGTVQIQAQARLRVYPQDRHGLCGTQGSQARGGPAQAQLVGLFLLRGAGDPGCSACQESV